MKSVLLAKSFLLQKSTVQDWAWPSLYGMMSELYKYDNVKRYEENDEYEQAHRLVYMKSIDNY